MRRGSRATRTLAVEAGLAVHCATVLVVQEYLGYEATSLKLNLSTTIIHFKIALDYIDVLYYMIYDPLSWKYLSIIKYVTYFTLTGIINFFCSITR